jgi:hypothetical protein
MQDRKTSLVPPSRRELMVGTGATALALAGGTGFARRPNVASGTVFEDRGGTGKRQPTDRGLAGVLVSNGRDVTATDADGRWRLSVADGDSLFVIKPSHWTTPARAGGVPHFSYEHAPQGSPSDCRYPGIGPTGELPARVDFALVRKEESARFDAILLSDTQPENDIELGYLRDEVVAGLIGSPAAFAINHGDVVADDLSLYPRYLQLTGATGMTWHHCPGNHDANTDAPEDGLSRETWKRFFGPRHYAFQFAGTTFILLDNVYHFGRGMSPPNGASYVGRIGEHQLRFVRNLLAHIDREQLVVVSMHIPLVSHQDPSSPSDSTIDRRALLELLSGRPHTVSFAGHMHTTEHHYLGSEEGFAGPIPHHHHVLTAASGSWWCGPRDRNGTPCADSVDGTPNGFHVLSVDGSNYTTRLVPAFSKSRSQMRVMVEGPHCRAAAQVRSSVPIHLIGDCEIIANVFDGGPRTTATCEIIGSGTGPLPMQRAFAQDPSINELFARPGAVRKPWVEATSSTHLWKTPVPVCLKAGAYSVRVRAVDEYGRQHVAHTVLEIAATGASAAT